MNIKQIEKREIPPMQCTKVQNSHSTLSPVFGTLIEASFR